MKNFNVERHLEPVADGSCVLRLARPPQNYSQSKRILPIQLSVNFELSTSDKQSVPPHLSVWVEELTTPEQARSFLGNGSKYTLVLRLKVDEIRAIKSSPISEKVYLDLLNVLWVHLYQENSDEKLVKDCRPRDCRPGAEGHSGITGLGDEDAPPELTPRDAKLLRKDLRAQLAELASKDWWSLG